LSEQAGIPYISDEKLTRMEVPRDLVKLLPREKADRLQAVPLSQRGKELYCAMRDPRDLAAVDQLKFITGSPVVRGVYATEGAIRKALQRFYVADRHHTSWGSPVALEEIVASGTPPFAARATKPREKLYDEGGLPELLKAQALTVEPSPPPSPPAPAAAFWPGASAGVSPPAGAPTGAPAAPVPALP